MKAFIIFTLLLAITLTAAWAEHEPRRVPGCEAAYEAAEYAYRQPNLPPDMPADERQAFIKAWKARQAEASDALQACIKRQERP